MATLTFEVALQMAGSLTTIGHPYAKPALDATAMDLMKWCKGGIFDGRVWTAEQMAEAMVEEARTTWGDWTEAGGTTALRALFKAKFSKPPASWEQKFNGEERGIASLIERGLLTPPCEHCGPADPYCEFGGAKRHGAAVAKERALGKEAMAREPPPPPPAARDYNEMSRRALVAYEDEQRRKAEQLQKVGMA